MSERRWPEMQARLTRQVQDFHRQLAEHGIWVRLDPDASLVAQLTRLEEAVRTHLDTCRDEIATLQQLEMAQQAREKQLTLFIDDAPVAIAMFDTQMRYLAASRRWMSDYGLHGNIIGLSHYMVFPEITDAWKAIHRRALAGETIRATNDRFERLNGSVQWLRWEVRPWYQEDGTVGGLLIFTEDITDLKAIEEQLQRQNRALRLLSSTNQVLTRAASEGELLQQVCHIAIDAGYRLAWVGYLTHDAAKTVAPVASAGLHRDYPQRHRFSWDAEQPEGRGLIGRAIRQRRSASANDLRTEPDIEPWREEALAQGFRSGIVLPLLAEDTVLGVLALYRGELYDYSTDECALLMQLVNDLSFGILSRRTQSAREEAEEALRKSEAQYRNLIETAQEGIWMVNRDMVTTYTNQRTAAMLGYTVAEVVGRSVLDLIPPELHAEMEEHIAKRRQGVREVYEFRFRRKDGSDIWVLVSGSPLYDDAGQFAGTFAMLTDITERHQAEAYQREFARKTIEAATGGKLIISDRQEIARLAGPALASWEIRRSDDLAMIRHAVAAMVCAAGMPEDRVHDFMLCISEAATNACKHAGGGRCSLHRTDDTLFAVVSDDGPGILAINLPELALQHGYTTAVSLGMGYKAMISLADHVYLATGPDGTVVGIRMALHAPAAPTQVFPGVADVW